MASGHDPDPNRDVRQVGEAREAGLGPGEDGEPSDAVEIRHEFPHSGPGVADRAPLAGRVGDLYRLAERPVLRALEVPAAGVGRNVVHDLTEQFHLKPLVLPVPLLQRNPLVEPHEVRHDLDSILKAAYRHRRSASLLRWSASAVKIDSCPRGGQSCQQTGKYGFT